MTGLVERLGRFKVFSADTLTEVQHAAYKFEAMGYGQDDAIDRTITALAGWLIQRAVTNAEGPKRVVDSGYRGAPSI